MQNVRVYLVCPLTLLIFCLAYASHRAPARPHRPIPLARLHRPAMPRSFIIPGFTQPHTGTPLVSVSIVRLPFPDDTRLCRAVRGLASWTLACILISPISSLPLRCICTFSLVIVFKCPWIYICFHVFIVRREYYPCVVS